MLQRIEIDYLIIKANTLEELKVNKQITHNVCPQFKRDWELH